MHPDPATARARLIEALRRLQDAEPLDVTVVFDGRSAVAQIDPENSNQHFVVKYAATGLTADGEIERLVASDPHAARCCVVTGDTVIRGNVLAAGGEILTPADLRAWMERAEGHAQRRLRTRSARNPSFGNKLPL